MNWLTIYKGKKEEFQKLTEEAGLGLQIRLTGAGNYRASDLETGLSVKDTSWQGAVRGLRADLGVAKVIWGEKLERRRPSNETSKTHLANIAAIV